MDRCEERKGLGAERELSIEIGELACELPVEEALTTAGVVGGHETRSESLEALSGNDRSYGGRFDA